MLKVCKSKMKTLEYLTYIAASFMAGAVAAATNNQTHTAYQQPRVGNGSMPQPPPICMGTKSAHECLLRIPKFRATNDAYIYGLPLLILVGSVGNLLSLIVFSRWQMHQTATYFYMAVLAVADLLVLYTSAFRLWIIKLVSFDIKTTSDAACRFFSFLPQWCTHFAVWILVAMTIDRFIAVNMPLRAIEYSTLPKARCAVFAIGAIFILLDMPILWKLQLTPQGKCIPIDMKWYTANHWIDMAVYSFIPFLILAIFNTIIARDMINARSTQQALRNGTNEQNPTGFVSKINLQVTSMLLFVTTAFLCFTLPVCILFIVREFVFSTDTLEGAIDYMVIDVALKFLMYLNHTCNVFFYCLVGRKFRSTLASMSHCNQKRRQTSVMGTAVTQTTRLRFYSSASQRYSVNA